MARVLVAVLGLGGVLVAPEGRADAAVPGIDAPGYSVRPLVEPHPLRQTDGMALDGQGGLWVTEALSHRVTHLDLTTLDTTRIADETDPEPLRVPDDIVLGPDGSLYVTAMFDRAVGLGLPLLNFSADVLVRRDGTVVVSGAADGSLVELTPR